jgi:glycosyltransferase involved in cell wall biosynthesis
MDGGKEDKLKVLHLVKTSIGAQWAVRQMRELVKLGIEVHAAVPPKGPRIQEYEAAGVTIHPFQLDFPHTPWRAIKTIQRLRKLVSELDPAIIHSHFVGTTLTMRLGLGKNHPIPRIFQVPGPLHLEHPLSRRIEISTAGRSDHWIGTCRATCNHYLKSRIPEGRVFLSYYGEDLEEFANCHQGNLRRELRVDGNTKIVGMVALMYPPKRILGQRRGLKGHEDLIDALSICIKTDPQLIGVFVGGAWPYNARHYEIRLRKYGKKLCGEHAVFLGTRDDVLNLYPDFDVAVHPSLSENLGAASESLLLAVPTIATAVGGFPDVVKSGTTGWLVPPQNPSQLAETILEALSHPNRSRDMARRGQALLRRLLDIQRTAREISEIYGSLTNGDDSAERPVATRRKKIKCRAEPRREKVG